MFCLVNLYPLFTDLFSFSFSSRQQALGHQLSQVGEKYVFPDSQNNHQLSLGYVLFNIILYIVLFLLFFALFWSPAGLLIATHSLSQSLLMCRILCWSLLWFAKTRNSKGIVIQRVCTCSDSQRVEPSWKLLSSGKDFLNRSSVKNCVPSY